MGASLVILLLLAILRKKDLVNFDEAMKTIVESQTENEYNVKDINGMLKWIDNDGASLLVERWCSGEKEKRVECVRRILQRIKTTGIKNIDEVCIGMFRDISKEIATIYNLQVTTVYDTQQNQNEEYHEGDKNFLVQTFSGLDIVNETELAWEQVLEFRKDEVIRTKYKRFLHWIDVNMIGRSQAFIEDEISLRLNDYQYALKKHGIKTVLGSISEILDGKFLLGSAAISGMAAYTSGALLSGLFTGGIIIIGKLAIKLANIKLDVEEIERGPNSEISWVYEVSKAND